MNHFLRGNYCVPQKVSRKSLEFKNAPKNDAQQKMHILQHQIDPWNSPFFKKVRVSQAIEFYDNVTVHLILKRLGLQYCYIFTVRIVNYFSWNQCWWIENIKTVSYSNCDKKHWVAYNFIIYHYVIFTNMEHPK